MTLNDYLEKVNEEFEKKFITKSVFGVSIGAIDNLNESGKEQVLFFLRTAITTAVQEYAEFVRLEESGSAELNGEISGEEGLVEGWNGAIEQIANKHEEYMRGIV